MVLDRTKNLSTKVRIDVTLRYGLNEVLLNSYGYKLLVLCGQKINKVVFFTTALFCELYYSNHLLFIYIIVYYRIAH
jgi:hypothetical protein